MTVDPDGLAHWFRADRPFVVTSHHGNGTPGTLAAYEAAYQAGYRWFQVDVVPIKDDLISLHTVFGRKRAYEHLTLAQLRVRLGRDTPPALSELLDAGFAGARWNIEVKSTRAIEPLVALLKRRTDLHRLMVSAPLRSDIIRRIQEQFGELVAVAAPLVNGGALGVVLVEPQYAADAVQLHRWRQGRGTKLRERWPWLAVQAWTINSRAQATAAVNAGAGPIVGGSQEPEVRDWLANSRNWPSPAPPPDPDELPILGIPTFTQLFLGGGGWRGAFSGIGAIAYLVDCKKWTDVTTVVGVSGGSFVAGRLMLEADGGAEPTEALRNLSCELLALRGPLQRRIALLAVLSPVAIVPGGLYLGRRLGGRLFASLTRLVFGDREPVSGTRRRYVICATGQDSALPYFFVPGAPPQPGLAPGPEVWPVRAAVAASSALPGLGGHRTTAVPDLRRDPTRGRPELLVDGGLGGIFGTQWWDRHRGAEGTLYFRDPTEESSLIIDAGRNHRRPRGLGRLSTLSTIGMLSRWVQIALDNAYQRMLRQLADPSNGGTTRVARTAETDIADRHHERARTSIAVRKLEHGRRRVRRFGLLGLNEHNARLTMTVAIAACLIEFETEDDAAISARLTTIGAAFFPCTPNVLADCWKEL